MYRWLDRTLQGRIETEVWWPQIVCELYKPKVIQLL